jgi:hypothetical protein
MYALEQSYNARYSILRASRLWHVDILMEVYVQECNINVHRVHGHLPFGGNHEACAQCVELNNAREGL